MSARNKNFEKITYNQLFLKVGICAHVRVLGNWRGRAVRRVLILSCVLFYK